VTSRGDAGTILPAGAASRDGACAISPAAAGTGGGADSGVARGGAENQGAAHTEGAGVPPVVVWGGTVWHRDGSASWSVGAARAQSATVALGIVVPRRLGSALAATNTNFGIDSCS
jgi:hypothetical protein